jgi:hypothetical protein
MEPVGITVLLTINHQGLFAVLNYCQLAREIWKPATVGKWCTWHGFSDMSQRHMPGFHVKWQVCTAADSGAPNWKLWLHWEHKQERQMEFRKMNVAGASKRSSR